MTSRAGRWPPSTEQMVDSASKTLDASVNNNPDAYRRGAVALVALIAQLPALQQALEDLAKPPTPAPSSAPPSPSATPAPSKTPLPAATPVTTPDPTSSAAPTASVPVATGDEQVASGGFGAAWARRWGLFLGPAAAATLSADTADPGAGRPLHASTSRPAVPRTPGSRSARPASLGGGAAVRADGLRACRRRPRDPRPGRLLGRGAVLGRIVAVSPQWTSQTFVFTASVGDPAATLELDLGRADHRPGSTGCRSARSPRSRRPRRPSRPVRARGRGPSRARVPRARLAALQAYRREIGNVP